VLHFALLFVALAVPLAAQTVYPPGKAVESGVLPPRWITGGPNCIEVPDWQVHEYNRDFYIVRQSGCTHYEKPFLYLIFGAERALLVDTGAGENDIVRLVAQIMRRRKAPAPLVVIHSHAHGDHTAGDKQLLGQANTTLIAANAWAMQTAFGVTTDRQGSIDLGSRVLDLIAIPGHDDASVAVYDRRTGILLTGDTLYPGRLYIRDWGQYAASARRLVDFTQNKTITHVLGAHIEQRSIPFSDYPRGTAYQPEEHRLELGRAHLLELYDAIRSANGQPAQIALAAFTLVPRGTSPLQRPAVSP
jgi:glyoxylase-like metal-dependent hydrolase (beta-lactamase superfamily II)